MYLLHAKEYNHDSQIGLQEMGIIYHYAKLSTISYEIQCLIKIE